MEVSSLNENKGFLFRSDSTKISVKKKVQKNVNFGTEKSDEGNEHKNVLFKSGNSDKSSGVKQFESSVSFKFSIQVKTRGEFGLQSAIGRHSKKDDDGKVSKFKFEQKPVTALDRAKASELISENGHFGAKKTGARIADSAISMAGDDVEKLKVAREATVKGFEEAEKIAGGKLFAISYDTLNIALKKIDDKINELSSSSNTPSFVDIIA